MVRLSLGGALVAAGALGACGGGAATVKKAETGAPGALSLCERLQRPDAPGLGDEDGGDDKLCLADGACVAFDGDASEAVDLFIHGKSQDIVYPDLLEAGSGFGCEWEPEHTFVEVTPGLAVLVVSGEGYERNDAPPDGVDAADWQQCSSLGTLKSFYFIDRASEQLVGSVSCSDAEEAALEAVGGGLRLSGCSGQRYDFTLEALRACGR